MSRVSGGESGSVDVVGDGVVEHFQGLSDRQWRGWLVGGEQWPEEPVVEFGVEDREALPVVGEDVGVRMGQLDDQRFQL